MKIFYGFDSPPWPILRGFLHAAGLFHSEVGYLGKWMCSQCVNRSGIHVMRRAAHEEIYPRAGVSVHYVNTVSNSTDSLEEYVVIARGSPVLNLTP